MLLSIKYVETRNKKEDPIMSTLTSFTLFFMTVVGILFVYFLPTIIAVCRTHPRPWAIFALNLIGGATVVGWWGALIWAVSNERNKTV